MPAGPNTAGLEAEPSRQAVLTRSCHTSVSEEGWHTEAENTAPPVVSRAPSALLLRSRSLAKKRLLPEQANLLQPDRGSAAVNLCPAESSLEIGVIVQ